jgi:hypothetical protein
LKVADLPIHTPHGLPQPEKSSLSTAPTFIPFTHAASVHQLFYGGRQSSRACEALRLFRPLLVYCLSRSSSQGAQIYRPSRQSLAFLLSLVHANQAYLPSELPFQFRDVTPGSTADANSPFRSFKPARDRPFPLESAYVDSQHPIHRCHPKDLPVYSSPTVLIRAIPFARLVPHASSHVPNPYPHPRKAVPGHKIPFSIVLPGGPQTLHKSGCIRTTVRRRVKEAVKLVVTRGASVADSGAVSFDEESALNPYQYILKGRYSCVYFTT